MTFAPSRYHPDVAAVLALDGDGQRPLPLVMKGCLSHEARQRLAKAQAQEWFAGSRSPNAALAALWLYFSCFDESHDISMDLPSAEGAYIHGILHRMEPDNWNAKYWLRQASPHPIHAELREVAAAIAATAGSPMPIPATWDSLWFADLHDAVVHDGSHPLRHSVVRIQLAEWQLLFHYCASAHDASAHDASAAGSVANQG
ncbi:MAG: hypothetical protein MUF01_10820 [Bryobacterales bacterium]|jgi:hypothetical protein|nr:hypothetical protein [Bryobacterales bacterium]